MNGGGPFHDGIAQVRLCGSQIKFVGKRGQPVEKLSKNVEANLYPDVDGNGRWGYVDAKGRERISHRFKFASNFAEGLALVQADNQKFGYIDRSGAFLIVPDLELSFLGSPSFQAPKHEFHNGLALAVSVKDEQGKRIEKYGFIDRFGKWVIEPAFDRAEPFSEGLAQVTVFENYFASEYFIDQNGKIQFEPWGHTQPFKDGLAFVRSRDGLKSGYIDKVGNFAIRTKSDVLFAHDFSEGLAAVMLDDGWTFIDKAGNLLSKERFGLVGSFADGLAPVEQNNKWGYVDNKGIMVISPEFDDADSFSDGLANVRFVTNTR